MGTLSLTSSMILESKNHNPSVIINIMIGKVNKKQINNYTLGKKKVPYGQTCVSFFNRSILHTMLIVINIDCLFPPSFSVGIIVVGVKMENCFFLCSVF